MTLNTSVNPIAILLRKAILVAFTAVGLLETASASCAEEIDIPKTVQDARVIVLGEVHGTAQIPALAAALLCRLAQPATSVLLALEIPSEQQVAIDAFVDGGASDDFERHNSNAWFWTRSFQDGRSSSAMLKLISEVRAMRARGADVQVLAFDRGAKQRDPAITRDEVMARNILAAMEKRPGLKVLVLAGNVHAKKTAGSRSDSEFKSATFLLNGTKALSFLMRSAGGDAWVCSGGTCGPRSGWGSPSAVLDRRRLVLDDTVQPDFDGFFDVGRITASPPAYTTTTSR